MTTTRTGIDAATPLGATVVPGATTFRLHAPRAAAVHVVTDDALRDAATYVPSSADALFAVGDGTWGASLAGIAAGARYRYWIDGAGSSGWKRDPRAREIDPAVVGSDSDCVVRDPTTWHWHDAGWRRPADADLVLYQLHVGTWSAIGADGSDRRASIGRFVDLLDRLDDLVALGINAVQLLPIQEFHTPTSLGYNGVDLYSPETDYRVCDPDDLASRVARIDAMYAKQGSPPLAAGALASGADQLRCVIDLFHLNGIAVFFDVVYNHAGPGLDDQSLYFLDRQPMADPNDSLYFTDREWAGGKVFAYWNADVRRFLVDNALAWIDEFHVDGLRYDEVTVIDTHGGRGFAQQCTTEVRARRADVLQIAEYWGDDRALAVRPAPDGLGFDTAWADGLRVAIRAAIAAASNGRDASVDLADVAAALMPPAGFPGATGATGAIQSIEDHDVVYVGRSPRIARLADPADPHSSNACGRARVALGLLLAAPGIPQLFMGQEFLATEPWSDDVADHPGCLIDWTSIATDRAARDYLRFTGDAIRLRRSLRGLRGAGVRAWATNATDRVLVVERWHDPVESVDDAVVVVFNLQEFARTDYVIGFPAEGTWRERFDSDWYDGAPNIATIGNFGQVIATSDRPWQGRPASASLTLPPNGWIAFTR